MGELAKLQQTLRWIDDNLHRLSYEKLREIYGMHLPRLPFGTVDFDNKPFFFRQLEYGGINVVYRAQLIKNDSNTPHSSVKELSYVPSDMLHYIENFGRVNKPHQSMFYGAFNPLTAAIETIHSRPEVIKKFTSFTIGVWKFEQPLTLAEVTLSKKQHDTLHRGLPESFNSQFNDAYFEELKTWIDNSSFDELERCVFEYFADKFCEFNENNLHYKVSNYYADRIFNRFPEHPISDGASIDGILYSSIAHTYQQKNIALLPEVVDAKLEFWCAEHMILLGGSIVPIDRAHADQDGNLIWQKAEWRKQQGKSA